MTILASIALAGEHIFQVLTQYLRVLQQYLMSIVAILENIYQVNTPYVYSTDLLSAYEMIIFPIDHPVQLVAGSNQ